MNSGPYFALAVMFCAGITAGCYLVTEGHPGFAVLVIVITGCLSFSRSET